MSDSSFGTAAADPQWAKFRKLDFATDVDAMSAPELALAVQVWQRIAWESCEAVSVEQFLTRFPKVAEDPECVFDLIYHEYLLRERLASAPDLEEFVTRFPEHASALRMQIAFRQALETVPADGAQSPLLDDKYVPAGDNISRDISLTRAIPGYEVLGEIGFGGMGVLYRARQMETKRVVAIKVLSAGVHAAAAQRARFRVEAELIARLQHPHIVQIHEAGEAHGCPYLVLEFVGGGNLRDRLQGMPHPPRSSARLVEVISRALNVAHVAGVVHRDLTPGNILFTGAGEPTATATDLEIGTPKIADFGLAKSFGSKGAADSGQRTMTGDLIGTPAYMSPEQASGSTRAIGPSSDIYSLGAILYELLTGRPPFRAVTAVETLQMVVSAEPVAPSRFQPGLPADLETICLKCLQKQPTQRYAGAERLADDLRRFLDGEPILARPVGPLTRLQRWCRRKPLLASMVSLVAVLLLAVAAISIAAAVRLNQAARDRLAEAKLAEARVHRLDNQLGRSDKGLAALAEAARIRATPEIRDEAIASLAQFDLQFDHYGPSTIGLIDFSTDLQCYAQRAEKGVIVVRQVADDAEVCRLTDPRPLSRGLFSPDGTHFICRWQNDLKIEVWFVGNAKPRLVVSEECDVLWGMGAVAFSNDGREVAIGRPDGLVQIYRLADGVRRAAFQVPPRIRHIAFRPQFPHLALALESSLQIRDVRDGRLLIQLDEAAASEYLTWHPRGRLLVTSDPFGGMSLWEPDQLRRENVLPGRTGESVAAAFNTSGTLLFSSGGDGSLRVWDPHWGRPLFTTIGSSAYFLRFSGDDRRWVGDVENGRIRVWRFPEAPAYRRLSSTAEFDMGSIRKIAISPGGPGRGRLLAAAMETGVGFWDLRTGLPVTQMAIDKVVDLAFDETGDLLTADAVKVQLWRIRESAPGTGTLTVGPPEHVTRNLNLSRMACSADGRVLGLARSNGRAVIVDRTSPQAAVELTSRANVFSIALTPDGSTAATAYTNGDLVQICDARNGKLIKELPTASSSVVFSPDGHRLLTSTDVLELWSVDDWKLLWKGKESSLTAHAFFPGGRFFAGGAQTGQIVIYSTADGHVAARLDDPTSTTTQFLAFAPDARSLVGLYRDLHQFSVWDLDSLGHRLSRAGLHFELTELGQREPVDGAAPLVVDIRLQDAHQPIEEGLVSIRRDLKHQPGNAALLFRLGLQLSKLGRDTEARDALAGAVGDGNSFVPSIELAACEIRLGHWREGLARFEHALANPSLAPVQSAGLCNQIAWYLNLAPPDDRDPRKAVEYAQRALEFDPDGFHFLTILGMALYRQGELPLAIETLRHSLKNSPHPIFDLYGLALCYQAAGDQTRAADFRSRADYLFELRAESLESQRRVELQGLREEYQRALSPSLE